MVQKPGQIITNLKNSGHRITKARSLIVEIFGNSKTPQSAFDILNHLKVKNAQVNKTTVYRELEFLTVQGIIKEVDFGEGKKRYELDDDTTHHHHIICINCRKVEDVDLKIDLEDEEKRIAKMKNFKVLNHSLEFFGLCGNCAKNH